ncbi:glycosyltransferase family 4 protein [Nodularia spumigena]|uniref:glycosyltransferase family 4 protein n=1 Tax=Nodularia spumigena TaxID=70799 RepID=UPI00232F2265|nr:glycosyltransferase family 4 protein [Nodularia spumigena]MDB9317348.1 glycosyltransferase family 4 protein [Nodularia spumigena CS-590/01A]MDB9335133.1 glycosyltransferase family 4 protein [Nodularia spumigena CS-590/01]
MIVRVAIVASYAPSLVNFRGHLVKTLEHLGAELLLIAPGLTTDILRPLNLQKAEIIDLPMARQGTNPFRDLASCYFLWRCFRKFSPDIVLAYTAKPVIYATLAAYLAGVPKRYALITGLGSAFTPGSMTPAYITWVMTQLYSLALRCNTAVIFQNTDDEKLFREKKILSAPVPSYVVNGSGVDLQHFSLSPLPESATFLLIARLLIDKGIREYVAAAAQIKLKHPQVRFLLVGPIDDNPTAISTRELQSWIDEGTVEYLGFLQDVRPAITQCSIYVLPSYREGTPRSILEAMAMGRPIITTDAPGCRETVKNGVNGYLIPVRDVNALVTSMEKLIVSPELRYQFGVASRHIAEEKYDVNKVNQQMLMAMQLTNT